MCESSQKPNPEPIALETWFTERLPKLGKLQVTQSQHNLGIDEFPSDWILLVEEANEEWLRLYQHQLTYEQVATAFFSSINQLGLLDVRP